MASNIPTFSCLNAVSLPGAKSLDLPVNFLGRRTKEYLSIYLGLDDI